MRAVLFGLGTVATVSYASSVFAHDDHAALERDVIEILLARPEIIIAALTVAEEREVAEKAKRERERVSSVASEVLVAEANGSLEEGATPLIAEFFDYRCGYCARAAEITEEFSENHDGRVRLVQFPILGEDSVAIARLAIGLRNTHGMDAYTLFHREMFEQSVQPKTAQTAIRVMASAGFDTAIVQEASLSAQ